MKHFFVLLALCGLLISTLAYAQLPQTISYQGLLTASNGAPIADGNYDITFNLYTAPTGGSPLWTELHSSEPVKSGTFSVILGSTTSLSDVNFNHQLYIAVTKGSDPEFSPRAGLTGAPFSLGPWAINGKNVSFSSGNVSIGTTTFNPTGSSSQAGPAEHTNNINLKQLTGNPITFTATGSDGSDNFILTTNGNTTQKGSATNTGGVLITTNPLVVQSTELKVTNALGQASYSVNPTGSSSQAGPAEHTGNINLKQLTGSPITFTATGSDGSDNFILTTNGNTTQKGSATNTGGVLITTNPLVVQSTELKVTDALGQAYYTLTQLGVSNQLGIGTFFGGVDIKNSRLQVLDSTGTAVFWVDSIGRSFHKGLETFNGGISILGGGLFMGSGNNLTMSGGSINVSSGGIITGSGSGITAINASNIATGTLADARTSSNVCKANSVNVFSVPQRFQSSSAGSDALTAVAPGQSSGASSGKAGKFNGDVEVTGTLTKGAGTFKIDHPLDPENKYLYHSFVESPDMMNVYNGNVITDANGDAMVTLPSYFEALNKDFRYQLTVIGQFAQAIVSSEINNNQFSIETDKPNVKVSWQVTGIRQDAYAKAHPIIPEVEKSPEERGKFMHAKELGKEQQLSELK